MPTNQPWSPGPFMAHQLANTPYSVFTKDDDGNMIAEFTGERMVGNAALFKAAPELVEAVRAFRESLEESIANSRERGVDSWAEEMALSEFNEHFQPLLARVEGGGEDE